MSPDHHLMISETQFNFVHLTDIHIIDEASAKLCARAFQQIHNLRPSPDFIVIGGDFVENGTQVEFDAVLPVVKQSQVPVYTLCGNHDLIEGTDPSRYMEHFGELCYSFDHMGYHFVMLDTTHRDYDTHSWHGYVQSAAMDWLHRELESVPTGKPILLFTHHGLVGSREDLSCDVENADAVLSSLKGFNLVAGFAGHAHSLRRNEWEGVPFFVNTALSQTRANPGGEPHGFLVVEVGSGVVSVRYHLID